MEGASGLLSVCISRISDLKMRMDLPSERAASGSFLAPKSRITTTARIAQCHGQRLPPLITARRPTDATAAQPTAGGPAPGALRGNSLVGLQGCRGGIPYTLDE